MGVDVGDYDGNGRLDLIVTHFSEDYSTLYENSDTGFFNDVTSAAGIAGPTLPYLGWGVGFVDIDNDGFLDVFIANGHVVPEVDQQGLATTYRQRSQLFRNQGNRRFEDVTDDVGGGLLIEKSTRGATFGDYDNDGDIDVLLINLNDRPTLLRNDTGGGASLGHAPAGWYREQPRGHRGAGHHRCGWAHADSRSAKRQQLSLTQRHARPFRARRRRPGDKARDSLAERSRRDSGGSVG